MTPFRFLRLAPILGAFAIYCQLSGCGGGGSSDAPSGAPPPNSGTPTPTPTPSPTPTPTPTPSPQPTDPTPPPPPGGPGAPAQQAMIGRTIELMGGEVHDIEADPARHRLYLSLPLRNEVVVMSSDTYLVEQRVFVGSSPQGMALSADGARLYVALGAGGSVTVVDLSTFATSTIEVATEVGTSYLSDVLEVRPGVALISGYRPQTASAYLVTLDTNDNNRLRRVADAQIVRGSPQLRASSDGHFVYVGDSDFSSRFLKLDNTSDTLPIVATRDAASGVSQFVVNSSGDMLMTGGGIVLDSRDFTTLLNGPLYGNIGATRDGSEMLRILGMQDISLLDGKTLVEKARFTADCPITVVQGVASVGLRGEWVIYHSNGTLCVVSTSAPQTKPGVDGSRALPPRLPPVGHVDSTIETFLGAPGSMELDVPRDLIYVTMPDDRMLLFVDATNGGVVDQISIPGKPGNLLLSADRIHLYVALIDQGSLVVVNLQDRQIERVIDIAAQLGRAGVSAMLEITANRMLVGATFSDPAFNEPYSFPVELDPAQPSTAHRIGDARGYCAVGFAISRDRRYVYMSGGNCSNVMEKRDLMTAEMPVVASSDPADAISPSGMAQSADGTLLYLPGIRIINASTLRQIGVIAAPGAIFPRADGAGLVVVDRYASRYTIDVPNQQITAILDAPCVAAYADLSGTGIAYKMWPDFSRYAVLAAGKALGSPGSVCIMSSVP